jgi:archaemetzincin
MIIRYWLTAFFISTALFFTSCKNKTTTTPKPIGVIVFGDIPTEYKDSVEAALARTYRIPIVFLGEQTIPKRFFVTIKSPRYRADSIIRYLKHNKPDSIGYVLGLTAFDISTTKRDGNGNILKPEYKYSDWGIFGLGYMPGVSCVVSSYRLKHPNKKVFISRLQKVAIHELGHNMGLPHCTNKSCVMTDAVERISTIDNEGFELCEECRSKIN